MSSELDQKSGIKRDNTIGSVLVRQMLEPGQLSRSARLNRSATAAQRNGSGPKSVQSSNAEPGAAEPVGDHGSEQDDDPITDQASSKIKEGPAWCVQPKLRVFVIGSPSPREIKVGHQYQFEEAAVRQGVDEATIWLVEQTGYDLGKVDRGKIQSDVGNGRLIWLNQETNLISVLCSLPAQSIHELHVESHGAPGMIALRHGWGEAADYGLSIDEAKLMCAHVFAPDAQISIDSCNAGTSTSEGNLAKTIADYVGHPVAAWTGRTSYHEVNDPNGNGRVGPSEVIRGGVVDWSEISSRVLGRKPQQVIFEPRATAPAADRSATPTSEGADGTR